MYVVDRFSFFYISSVSSRHLSLHDSNVMFVVCCYMVIHCMVSVYYHRLYRLHFSYVYRKLAQLFTHWLQCARAKGYVTIAVRDFNGRSVLMDLELRTPIWKLISIIEKLFSFNFDEQKHMMIIGKFLLKRDCSGPLSHYCEGSSTIHLLGKLKGGGSAFNFVSNCPVCPGKSLCEVLKYCVDNMSSSVDYANEDTWIGLCKSFNISNSVKRIIMENTESDSIRCADVIHRLCHTNPTLTWSTIKEHIHNANFK